MTSAVNAILNCSGTAAGTGRNIYPQCNRTPCFLAFPAFCRYFCHHLNFGGFCPPPKKKPLDVRHIKDIRGVSGSKKAVMAAAGRPGNHWRWDKTNRSTQCPTVLLTAVVNAVLCGTQHGNHKKDFSSVFKMEKCGLRPRVWQRWIFPNNDSKEHFDPGREEESHAFGPTHPQTHTQSHHIC